MGAITALFARKVIAAVAPPLDPTALLQSVGLDPQGSPRLEERVADGAYYDLLERLARCVPEEQAITLPLRVGASMRCDDYGAFGLAWKTASTLRDSFARAERYWRLLSSVSQYQVTAGEDGEAWYLLHRAGERRLGLRLSNEATLASVVTLVREVCASPVSPLAVHLRHSNSFAPSHHQRFFGCPVHFNAECDGLVYPAAALAVPTRLGDEGISRFLLSHLDQALDDVPEAETDLPTQVQALVASALSAGVPPLADMAARLGMSERSLQRRLSAEGTSYQQVVDQARRDLAQGLLSRTSYPLAEVAFVTGFSEQSAFTRAFKRWCQLTPAAFRAAQE